jgi:hypothetical protein
MYTSRRKPWKCTSGVNVTIGFPPAQYRTLFNWFMEMNPSRRILDFYKHLSEMTVSKTRMQRQVRDRKDQKKFFIALGIITLLLILVLFLVYS